MGGGAFKTEIRMADPPSLLPRERYPFKVLLPLAPSINALFGQAPGRKRYPMPAYKAWIEEAGWLLKQSHPPRYPGQIWLAITYPDSGRFDLDNRIKMYPDLLKKHGVLVDDSRKYLRGLHLSWGDVSGALVEISPVSFSETRSV